MIPSLTKKQWMWIGITYLIYGLLMGWPLATAIVFTIGFHEMCHLTMAHKLGMKTNGFILMPFIGGLAFITSGYRTLWNQALVVFAGPLGGGLMSFITFGLGLLTGSAFLEAIAFWMGAMNLLNLIPIGPLLDGGQLMNTLTFSINRKVGLYIMTGSTIIGFILIGLFNPLIAAFVLVFGLMHCRREYRNQKNLAEGNTFLCTPEFLNKPYPLSRNKFRKVIMIWLSSVVILGSFCFILYRLGLSNLHILHSYI